MRIALLAAIFATAWYQGRSGRTLAVLAIMVLWAASLPVLARFVANYLERAGVEGTTRTILVILACLLLLGAFAITARLLLPVA